MSQNKKRQHEQGGASEGSGSEAPTTTKRTLLNHNSNHSSLDKSLVKAMNAGTAVKTPIVPPQKQGARSPTKSLKPQQSINLNMPDEIYYVPTTNLV